MSTVFTPAANLYIPSTVNHRILNNSTLGTGIDATYTPAVGGSGFLLLGVDMTATQANPIQVFANCSLGGGAVFYWDSQSTGEGNGVTFAWRGQMRILPGETLHCTMSASGAITLGVVAWGLSGQFITAVNNQ